MTVALSEVQLRRAASLLTASRRAIALTGAGFSTPSGIPDFRSSGSGLWTRYDPMEVASLPAFRYDPDRFFSWFHDLAGRILYAQPNPAHIALARLEQLGMISGVITQNIDGLHQAAGSKIVHEVHGHLRSATCLSCHQQFDSGPFLSAYLETGQAPRCPQCHGYMKPNVVLFGEQLPYEPLQQAHALIRSTDLMLIGGSSLEVAPAAQFPLAALDRGARLIIVNQEPTYLDRRAEVVFEEDVAVVLPSLVEEVQRG